MRHTTSTATVTTRPDPPPDAHPGGPDRADAGAAASSLQNPPPPHPMPVDEVTRRLAELAELVDAATAWQTARLTARIDQLTAELAAERHARMAAERAASHDQLTGLPNRRSLIAGWTPRITAVIMVDVDAFKIINDTHGHDIGDLVLTETAHRLTGLPELTAHRVGGDEYVLTTTIPRHLHDGLLTTIRDVCSTPVTTPAGPIGVTVSVGGAATSPDDELATALRRADLGMYHAKTTGRPMWWSTDLTPPPAHPRRRANRDHQQETP